MHIKISFKNEDTVIDKVHNVMKEVGGFKYEPRYGPEGFSFKKNPLTGEAFAATLFNLEPPLDKPYLSPYISHQIKGFINPPLAKQPYMRELIINEDGSIDPESPIILCAFLIMNKDGETFKRNCQAVRHKYVVLTIFNKIHHKCNAYKDAIKRYNKANIKKFVDQQAILFNFRPHIAQIRNRFFNKYKFQKKSLNLINYFSVDFVKLLIYQIHICKHSPMRKSDMCQCFANILPSGMIKKLIEEANKNSGPCFPRETIMKLISEEITTNEIYEGVPQFFGNGLQYVIRSFMQGAVDLAVQDYKEAKNRKDKKRAQQIQKNGIVPDYIRLARGTNTLLKQIDEKINEAYKTGILCYLDRPIRKIGFQPSKLEI